MRAILALALFAAVGVAAVCRAQSMQARTIDPALERCIRDNAPKVERAIADLSDAVTYLTQDVCAVQGAAVQRRDMQARMTSMRNAARQQCEANRASTSAQHQADPDDVNPCQAVSMYDMAGDWSGIVMGQVQPTPEAVARASQLLLDQRLADAAH